MTKLEKLEHEVQRFSRAELITFRNWFRKYDSNEWDRQIEDDALSGKLDKMVKEALTEDKAGKTRKL